MSEPTTTAGATQGAREPIAIVGIGCRLPGGADSPAQLWRLLCAGFDAIGPIPPERFDAETLYDERPATPGKIMTRWGGFLSDIDRFDADFFGISPREAERLDPQQRLLLEVAWEALADAGAPAEALRGSQAGVFVGMWLNEFESRLFADPGTLDLYMTTGSGRYSASGRISYFLDLRGPSITIDTACSSSLVAVHLACQSLWSGECGLALAGGANVILQPHITIAYSQSRMMAPDGRCKFGDARADGYVRSDGAAIVALKPLARALADGDPVYAVIRGSAVTNDGRSSGFLATPGQAGQEEMLRRAYASAGVDPRAVQYIEAHGTGTRAGDPVEVGAIGAVLGAGRAPDAPCLVGSIKTNIGHTEGAAGVAGMIKVALALKHRHLPASLHVQQRNPAIPWEELGLALCAEARPWPAGDQPATAGVSSFGIAGTNAHVVLQEPPAPPPAAPADGRAQLLTLSAHTPAALVDLARACRALLGPEGPALADLCYSAGARQAHHEHRLAVAAGSGADVAAALDAFAAGQAHPAVATGQAGATAPRVVFVFPGQGSQWPGMARELLRDEPAFRASIERCDRAIRAETGWSLLEQLGADEGEARLDEIDVIQPTLFAIQVSLAALWRAWGVEPAAVVGHSMGEVAAAHVAGALSLEDAAAVICRRSRLLRRVRGRGAMAVVDLTLAEARAAIAGREDRLAIAVNNSQRLTVLSGDPEALAAVVAELEGRGVYCRPVKVDVASHSPQMDPLLDELRAALAGLAPRPAEVPLASTVEERMVDGAALDAAYWARNLRQPVLFAGAVQRLMGDGHTHFIEMSPHPILLPALEQLLQQAGQTGAALPSLRRAEPERARLLLTLGALYAAGAPVRWAGLYPDGGRHVAPPLYPWQRSRYWLERRTPGPALAEAAQAGGLLGRRLPALVAAPELEVWSGQLDEAGLPAALRTPVERGAVLAGAAFAWLALEAAASAPAGAGARVRDLVVRAHLPLEGAAQRTTQTTIAPGPDGAQLRCYSRAGADEPWVEHASATLAGTAPMPPALDPEAIRAACAGDGAPRPGLAELRLGPGLALARLSPLEGEAGPETQLAAGLALLAALGEAAGHGELLLAEIGELRGGAGPEPAWAYGRVTGDGADGVGGEVYLLDEGGRVIVACLGVRLHKPDGELRAAVARARIGEWLYELDWRAPGGATPAAPAGGAPGRWVLFADAAGVAGELARLVAADGGAATLVYPGPAGAAAAGGGLRVDPEHPEGLRRALEEGGAPATVVYLWGLDLASGDHLHGEELLERQRAPIGSALLIAQALARAEGARPRLWLVTRGAVAAGAPATLDGAAQAGLWGLGRVIASEHPELWGGLADLDEAAPATAARALYAALRAGDGEDQVALRGGERRVARLVRAPRTAGAQARLRPDGAYLITGGLGGVGLALARWMLANGARHLALLGRRPLGAEALQTLADLERDGARVVYVQADVARADALAAALERLARVMPPLRGVVHAAGALDDAALLGQSWGGFARVMAAKVAGAWNLHRQTAGRELDLFVLCSSVNALLGMPGQANYAAANACLDALAHARRTAGLPALSINWGRWGEVGLAVEGTRGEQLERRGLGAMAPAAGAAAFGRALGRAGAQVAVAEMSWPTFVGQLLRPVAPPLLAELAAADVAEPAGAAEEPAALLRALERAPAARRYDMLLEHVQASVAEVLRFDGRAKVDPARGFFQIGMDSLMALELRNRLGSSLGRAFSATLAFDYPTAAALTRHLLAELLPAQAEEPLAPAEPEDELAALELIARDDLKSLLDAELDAIDQ